MARATKAEKADAAVEKKEPRFTKEQLLLSDTFSGRRDVVSAVLSSGKTYTIAEANEAIKKFYERRVK